MNTSNKKTKKDPANIYEAEKNTFRTIGKSMSKLGGTFSDGADKVADIFLDKDEKGIVNKTGEIKKEFICVFKNAAKGIRSDLKTIKTKDIVFNASHQLGRFVRITRDTCVEIFNDLME